MEFPSELFSVLVVLGTMVLGFWLAPSRQTVSKTSRDEFLERFPDDDIRNNLRGAWSAVVRVTAVAGPLKRQHTDDEGHIYPAGSSPTWTGTGFLIQRPPVYVAITSPRDSTEDCLISWKVNKLLLTNRHVYRDVEFPDEEIHLSAEFDEIRSPVALRVPPLWRSNDTDNAAPYASLRDDKLDFAAFEFDLDDDPDGVAARHVRGVEHILLEESGRISGILSGAQIAVIGYPRGGPKCGSVSTLLEKLPDYDIVHSFMRYGGECTEGGSSGSPVWIIDRGHQLLGSRACALHYRKGLGVRAHQGFMASIRNQYTKQVVFRGTRTEFDAFMIANPQFAD